jgi:hypothetical protein
MKIKLYYNLGLELIYKVLSGRLRTKQIYERVHFMNKSDSLL